MFNLFYKVWSQEQLTSKMSSLRCEHLDSDRRIVSRDKGADVNIPIFNVQFYTSRDTIDSW